MTEEKAELSWEDIHKLTAEVISDHGPGSKAWKAEGSETQRVNEHDLEGFTRNKFARVGNQAGINASAT